MMDYFCCHIFVKCCIYRSGKNGSGALQLCNGYPLDLPELKHNLLIDAGLVHQRSATGNDTSTLLGTFDALESVIVQSATSLPSQDSVKLVSIVYTYSDAPTDPKPLSCAPRVCGFLRRGLFGQCAGSDLLQKCIIAVKLPTTIPQDDVESINNSESFHKFTRELHYKEEVALLACDSSGNVGFIVPISSNGHSAELYYVQKKDFLHWVRDFFADNTASINPASQQTSNAGSSRDSRARVGGDDWDRRGSNNQRLVRDQVGGDSRGDSRARVGGDDWDRRGSNSGEGPPPSPIASGLSRHGTLDSHRHASRRDHHGGNNQRLPHSTWDGGACEMVGGPNRGTMPFPGGRGRYNNREMVGGPNRGVYNQRLPHGNWDGGAREMVGGPNGTMPFPGGRGGYNDRGGGGGWGGGVSVAAAALDLVCHRSCLTLLLVSDTQTY